MKKPEPMLMFLCLYCRTSREQPAPEASTQNQAEDGFARPRCPSCNCEMLSMRAGVTIPDRNDHAGWGALEKEALDLILGETKNHKATMSAIDCARHLRIGLFLGIPVYQLLEENSHFQHRNPQDGHKLPPHLVGAGLPKDVITVGGGDGEHPAIAFYDPVHCVARYLEYCLRFAPQVMGNDLKAACAHLQGDLQTIEYCNWQSENHVKFRRLCGAFYELYEKDLSFEAWLLACIGEFVFHVMPSFDPKIREWHTKYLPQADCWFQVISIPYDYYGGNGRDRFKIVDTETGESPAASPLG